jgi:hypothetical protein
MKLTSTGGRLATSRRKIDVSAPLVNGVRQAKPRRGDEERRSATLIRKLDLKVE